MCDVAERLVKQGLEEGLEQGLKQGRDDERAALMDTFADYNAGVSVKEPKEK